MMSPPDPPPLAGEQKPVSPQEFQCWPAGQVVADAAEAPSAKAGARTMSARDARQEPTRKRFIRRPLLQMRVGLAFSSASTGSRQQPQAPLGRLR
jgi:hypothetical protein